MIDNGFENLNDALEVEFEPEEKNEIEKIKTLGNKKNELSTIVVDEYSLKDEEYVRFELKSLLMNSLNVLNKLEQDINIGTNPKSHETYFMGVRCAKEILTEIGNLDKKVVDVKIEKEKIKKPNNPQNINNLFLSANDINGMIKSAKQNSQLNQIDTKFNLEDDLE